MAMTSVSTLHSSKGQNPTHFISLKLEITPCFRPEQSTQQFCSIKSKDNLVEFVTKHTFRSPNKLRSLPSCNDLMLEKALRLCITTFPSKSLKTQENPHNCFFFAPSKTNVAFKPKIRWPLPLLISFSKSMVHLRFSSIIHRLCLKPGISLFHNLQSRICGKKAFSFKEKAIHVLPQLPENPKETSPDLDRDSKILFHLE